MDGLHRSLVCFFPLDYFIFFSWILLMIKQESSFFQWWNGSKLIKMNNQLSISRYKIDWFRRSSSDKSVCVWVFGCVDDVKKYSTKPEWLTSDSHFYFCIGCQRFFSFHILEIIDQHVFSAFPLFCSCMFHLFSLLFCRFLVFFFIIMLIKDTIGSLKMRAIGSFHYLVHFFLCFLLLLFPFMHVFRVFVCIVFASILLFSSLFFFFSFDWQYILTFFFWKPEN